MLDHSFPTFPRYPMRSIARNSADAIAVMTNERDQNDHPGSDLLSPDLETDEASHSRSIPGSTSSEGYQK